MRIIVGLSVLTVACLGTGSVRAQIVLGPATLSPTELVQDSWLAAADLDGDGDLDLGVLHLGATQVHFGDGRGHFAAAVDTDPQLDLDAMDLGDVNGDGHPDLVGLRIVPAAKQLYLMLGQGGEHFELVAIYDVPGEAGAGSGRVQLSDADGDGDLDALVISGMSTPSASRVDEFSNDGLGHFTPHVVSTGVVPFAAVAADLDADGDADVVESDGSPFQPLPWIVRVLLGQPDTSFVSAVTWNDSQLIAVADLDQDGALDVLASDTLRVALRAHMGLGDGSFSDGPVTAVTPIGEGPDRVADFDGDGVPDLLVTVPNPGGHTAIRRGDGQGGFAATDGVAVDLGTVSTVIIADVIADGRPDVVTSRGSAYETQGVVVFPNWTYPAGGPLLDLGYATPAGAGFSGYPVMAASGDFTAGAAVEFHLFSAWPQGPTALIAGFSEDYAPFHGGTLVPSPDIVLGLFVADAEGGLGVQAHWPPGVPSGTQVTMQFWTQWPHPFPGPYVASSAVRVTAP